MLFRSNAVTGTVYAAGTQIPTTAFNPTSLQVVNFFKQIPGLPVSGAAATGIATADYAVQVPFTDHADKGDLRLDYQQNPTTSWRQSLQGSTEVELWIDRRRRLQQSRIGSFSITKSWAT